MGFEQFDLDSRIQRAIAKLGFTSPTLVQETAIPLALQGKDILARAKTGSGKTAAYCIPIIQKILSSPSSKAIVLVPTRELSLQVYQHLKELCMYCTMINIVNLSIDDCEILANPNIIVATPAKICFQLEAGKISLSELESLVIDEADLILSYGYDEQVSTILKHLPQIYQSYLMSATLSADVTKLKKLILRNPAILQLEEDAQDDLLTQYYINCSEQDKYLFVLFMLKLKVHPFGSQKSIIFVNSIDKCYKLRLFLQQFGIRCCTLNSELPVKSRYHIVQEFNKGVYDFIIATDESGNLKNLVADSDDEQVQENDNDEPEGENKNDNRKKQRKRQDQDYGVSRGIDFKNVSAVINFDMPLSSRTYQHRVGRTARGVGNRGYSLTFVCPKEKDVIHTRKKLKVSSNKSVFIPSDEDVLARVQKRQKAIGRSVDLFKFDMEPVERFRYRCQDALQSVSISAIKEARLKEIKSEVLNSEKLKAHFEDNPADLQALRHDKSIHAGRLQTQMRHVPKYLLPNSKLEVISGDTVGYVPFKMDNKRRGKKFKNSSKPSKAKSDPLKSFSYKK